MTPALAVFTVGGACAATAAFIFLRNFFSRIDRRVMGVAIVGASAGVSGWVVFAHGVMPLLVAVPVLAAVVTWLVVRRTRTATTITRWGARSRRRSGVATTLDILRVASGWAMRRKARIVRPSMRDLTWRQLWKIPAREFGVELCRTARMRVHASIEDVILVFGGPRTGKSGWLAGPIIDAPGAVLTTSTRTDLMDNSLAQRTEVGPVSVWNPGGLGDIESTIAFDPLTGCAAPAVATERAADMIPEAEHGDGKRGFWEGQARRVLAALMHAASLDPDGTRGMEDVQRWAGAPEEASAEIQALLRRSPQPSYAQNVHQWITCNNDTRSSITTTMMPALAWLTSASAVAATKGGKPFDVAELIRSRGTVYLFGRHEAHTAPLLAAFNGYVIREARRIAGGRRLDPPLSVYPDEAGRVAPIPLPDISGDAGGSGIHLVCAFQSRADVIDRWGKTGASKLINNAGTVMLFGGTKDPEDLEAWSKLAGDRDEVVKNRDKDGKVVSTTVRKTPVLSPAQLSNLPEFHAVLFSRGMAPVVGRAPMVWERSRTHTTATRWVGAQSTSQRPVTQVSPALPSPKRPSPTQAAPALPGVGARPVVKEPANASH